jgi:hypothetical protein
MLAGGGLGACGGTVSPAEFTARTGVSAPPQPDPDATTPTERESETRHERIESPSPGAGPIGFGSGRTVVDAALAALDGERSLVEVVLYDGYAIVTARSPATGLVDRVVVRPDHVDVTPPTPAPPTPAPQGDATIAATEVDWDLVGELVARTPTELGVDGPVSHVIVERDVTFADGALVVRAYVRRGRIDWRADGSLLRKFGD